MTLILEGFLVDGESFHVERKETVLENALREAACAFTNDLPGSGKAGAVVVGVADDGRPAGDDVTDAILRQLADIKRTAKACHRLRWLSNNGT